MRRGLAKHADRAVAVAEVVAGNGAEVVAAETAPLTAAVDAANAGIVGATAEVAIGVAVEAASRAPATSRSSKTSLSLNAVTGAHRDSHARRGLHAQTPFLLFVRSAERLPAEGCVFPSQSKRECITGTTWESALRTG